MTVGGMDADTERTRMYLQRVMSGGYPLHLLLESVTNLKWSGKAYVTQR